jgi:hypothetical protein
MAIRKFKHYKSGKIYELLTNEAKDAETSKQITIIKDVSKDIPVNTGQFWCGPTDTFFEKVEYNGKMVPIFEEIK